MTKPVIVTFASYYLPGFKAGGPIPSLANIVEALGDEFDFRIITRDRDLGDEQRYPSAPHQEWTPVGRALVWYTGSDWSPALAGLRIDGVYLNSFFDPHFTLKTLMLRRFGGLRAPTLLAPRGELSPAALSLKRLRKRLVLGGLKAAGVYDGIVFHASSAHEAEDIRNVLGAVQTEIALDLPGRPDTLQAPPANAVFSIAFLSRISPMKNLLAAIEIVGGLKTSSEFTVYGPIESPAYWEECQAQARTLPPHIRFTYGGPVEPRLVERTLARHDVFLLPTCGENYGHVIREALCAGLPVVISDRTPWRDLGDAGAVLPLGAPEPFRAWLEAFASSTPADRALRREAARSRGADPKVRNESTRAMRSLLHRLVT